MLKSKTLCLNMIVRNERANLERCLTALADHIECWVIADTGSTDGTPDFIRSFFAARKKPGELHSIPFQTFEQARNAALDCAYGARLPYDYLLLADADMELVVEDHGFRERLDAAAYQLLQRTADNVAYWNTRLVRREVFTRYYGVTHEFLYVPDGVKTLAGVWYKDHASGANRPGKFDRDIRLLSAALERNPDNHRNWFYLAQSYRDAGRIAEAVQAYARRAEMGGWDEEVWTARVQEARCRRALGDDGDFVRQALAAFAIRPHRAEPLYDLARFYREEAIHEVSALFSEVGLTIERPTRDLLFVEDFVYTAGLEEEYAIAAYYARDPVRRDRGFAAANWLALNPAAPDRSRDLARQALSFYVKPAGAILRSFTARRLGLDVLRGGRALNPSVARLGQQIVVLVEVARSEPSEDGSRTSETASLAVLLRLNDALEIGSAAEVLAHADRSAAASSPGLRNPRAFEWRGGLWVSASLPGPALVRIDEPDAETCRLTDWRALQKDGPKAGESSWMPVVSGEHLQFMRLGEPTVVVDDRGATVVTETTPVIAAGQFAGGSQLLGFDGGWLALVHDAQDKDGRRLHHHRFVWFDAAGTVRKFSRPFFFHNRGIEIAAGLAWHPDQERLLISYGVAEREAWIATVSASEVRGVLEDAVRPPRDAAVEAVFASLHTAAKHLEAAGRSFDEVMATYLSAANVVPTRAEALHGAVRYCRMSKRYKEGYDIAKRALAMGVAGGSVPAGALVEPWIYEYGLLDEFAVLAGWVGAYTESLDACLRLLGDGKLPESERERVSANARSVLGKLPRLPDLGRAGKESLLDQHPLGTPRALRSQLPAPASRILLAILARQQEAALPLYLACLEALDYPKSSIVLYIRTNDNTDRTESILREWVARVGPLYSGVEFDAGDVGIPVEPSGADQGEARRARFVGQIRNISLRRALDLGCEFYFTADVNNFVRPCTLRELSALNLPMVAPFLRSIAPGGSQSNYHAEIDANGYYRSCDQQLWVFHRWIRGVIELPVVNGTYLLRTDVIPELTYEDTTARHNYVVLSHSARKAAIPQYIDNRQVYGYILAEAGDPQDAGYGIEQARALLKPELDVRSGPAARVAHATA